MEIEGRNILILGGSGLVGLAVARRLLPHGPAKIVIAALREDEAREGVAALEGDRGPETSIEAEWGDIFLREAHARAGRVAVLRDPERTEELLEDIFGLLDESLESRSALVRMLDRHRPGIVVDCINTATAIAYQNVFHSSVCVREAAATGPVDPDTVRGHLATLYLPQLIRHVQLLMVGLRRAGTGAYVKIGTSGTGGMGLNVPFTHSEERPSRTLLAKASIAGAHSMLLFLLGRTPDTPAIIEIKPTAAIAWKGIGYGPVRRGGRPVTRSDASRAVPPAEAFGRAADSDPPWADTGEALESVYVDAGENGLFALSEFETISSLGLMELVTPEEIASAVAAELAGRPTGRDIVSALDASVFGPTYRGGMLREAALTRMEELEREHDVRSVAFEMLGPPRLTKLLFEASVLERLYGEVDTAADLDPEATAAGALALIETDDRLRTDVLSAGIPILRPDGLLLRGSTVNIEPGDGPPDVDRLAHDGWLDLRPSTWEAWRERCRQLRDRRREEPGVDVGSRTDVDLRARSSRIRPGAIVAHVLRVEEKGERIKR